MPVGGAVDAEERAIAEDADVLLLRDGATASGGAQADVAIGQRLPGRVSGIGCGEEFVALEQDAFGASEEALPESAHLMERDVCSVLVDEGPPDVPEKSYLASVGILAVDFELADADGEPLLRPGTAMIVAVFEDVISLRVDTGAPSAFVGRVVGLDAAEIVGVVIVEGEDASARRLEHNRVGGLGSVGGFDVDGRRPGPPSIGAAQGDHVLAAGAFVSGARGENAEPGAVVGLDDVGLVGVVLGGDLPSGADVAQVFGAGQGKHCHSEQEECGGFRHDSGSPF